MVRRWADWPTSVLSMSARLGPSQSSEVSPDAFRKGRMAREACSSGVPRFAVDPEKILPRKTIPSAASKTTAAAPTIQIRCRWKSETSEGLGAEAVGGSVGGTVRTLVGDY